MIAKISYIVGLLTIFLAGCSIPENPEQIAVFPKEEPIAVYANSPEWVMAYNATIELEVSNVDRAADRARQIAFEHGGYMISTQSWYRDGERHTTIVLAVPVYQFEATQDKLLGLGKLVGKWISSDFVPTEKGSWDSYIQFNIYLHPKDSLFSEVSLPTWRPVRTFEKALGVFVSIFGYLLDIVIWIVVVPGPFILMGWGIYKIFQWRNKPINKSKGNTES